MSGIKWEDVDRMAGCSVGVVGPYQINAFGNGYWGNWQMRRAGDMRVIASASLPETRENPPTLAAVKLHADATLLDLHNAFATLFAPVLRWEHGEHESTAALGQWRLSASAESWSVGVVAFEWVAPAGGGRASSSRENNRRGAEAALRGLGVMFRTEDGQ